MPAVQEMQIWSLGQEHHLEEGMATHSSILAWEIPWTEEPGGLYSMGSQRVGHDLEMTKWQQYPCHKLRKIHILKHFAISMSQELFYYSVQFSRSVVSDSLRPHELQHARPPCPSLTPRVHPNPCPLSRWCHPTISSSVIPFSSCLQSFPASGSFQMSQPSTSGGQSIGVSASASVLPMNTQDWSPLGWTGWISLQPKGLSRVFSNTTVQKHQFFGTQLSFFSICFY